MIRNVRRTSRFIYRTDKPLRKIHSGRRGRGTAAVHAAAVPDPHCLTNEDSKWNVLKIMEHANGQDSLGVVGDTVTFGPEVLHVAKCSITGRVDVVGGNPLMLHLLEPVRLILGCAPIT